MALELTVIGGGLAGCEAALKAAELGVTVTLIDMKPAEFSPAHKSPLLGELVCSNSLRSADPFSAVGLLKVEMSLIGSAVMKAAKATAVPAGKALAVDREGFARFLDDAVSASPLIQRQFQRVDKLPPASQGLTIIATGPLTADALAQDLDSLTGSQGLHFYDAIAPIVTLESVDLRKAFWADRYGVGTGDYLNCPLSEDEYRVFYQALLNSEQVPLHDFESPKFFEGCLPVEVLAARGEKTLLFGPMKPVGLTDPRTGERPFAVVQLRKEDKHGRLLNLVGFQTKLTYSSQKKVFRLIPALARAEFARLGSIHRNTFIDAPRVLGPDLRLLNAPHIFIAGQLSGVEGYVESSAMGLLAGLNASRLLKGLELFTPPVTTALGGLVSHLQNRETKNFQPSNVNFGLLPPLGKKLRKKDRGRALARRALADLMAQISVRGMIPAEKTPEI